MNEGWKKANWWMHLLLPCTDWPNTADTDTYRNSSKNSANEFFIEEFLLQTFGGKICYVLKIDYFTSKLGGYTVYYSCVLGY